MGSIQREWVSSEQREMPKYKCHKEVWALKIKDLEQELESSGLVILTPVEEGYTPFKLTNDYVDKYRPVVGGYYVVYEDGYKSFSPAEPFEAGYTKI